MKLVAPFLLLTLLVGCRKSDKPVVKHTTFPNIQMVILDPELQPYCLLWQKEVQRRFTNALVIFCHGTSLVEGEWIVQSPFNEFHGQKVQTLVQHYKTIYPDRVIVLISCNPDHLKLGIPGVYYSHSSVWLTPDRNVIDHYEEASFKMDGTIAVGPDLVDPKDRQDYDTDSVGSIFEFEKDD